MVVDANSENWPKVGAEEPEILWRVAKFGHADVLKSGSGTCNCAAINGVNAEPVSPASHCCLHGASVSI